MNDIFHEVIQKENLGSFVNARPVAGGCINSTYWLTTTEGSFFLKWNEASLHRMFEAEDAGLKYLNEASPIHTPKVIAYRSAERHSYLLLEWIEKGTQSSDFWQQFGHQLATQHRKTHESFGLDHDNFIGSLDQINSLHTDWYEFFIECRLKPQLALAEAKGLVDHAILTHFEILYKKLPELVPKEPPALLHGDLWSGNFMVNAQGGASIFDPAIHFGHRETELAFTTLFGGFSDSFYESYSEEHPLSPGFQNRIAIHNLYPLLVHVNLFGHSYLSGITQTLKQFT